MKLMFVEKMEKIVDGTRYVRATYTIGAYTVTVDDSFYSDGKSRRSIDVTEPWNNKEYIPHIYYRDDFFGRKVSYFEIQTTSFGALDVAEFKRFLEAQQKALEIVEVLNREFGEVR